MLQGLGGWHLIAILAIILLLFGAPRLPALAKSIGQSMKIFRNEVKTEKPTDDSAEVSADTDAPAAPSGSTPPRNG